MLDLPTPQVPAIPAGRVRLIATHVIGARARMATGRTWDTDAFEDRDQLRGIAPLAWCDDERERTSAALTGQMYLAGQPTSGAAQGLIRTMLNRPAASSREARLTGTGAGGVLMGAAADHLRCLSCTVFHFPNRAGKSRHGTPVRCRKRMPLITLRWLFQRPPRPTFFGKWGSSRAHS